MSDGQTETAEMQEQWHEGPPRRYVPVCLRHNHGFEGGPVGYEEGDGDGPIIVDTRKHD